MMCKVAKLAQPRGLFSLPEYLFTPRPPTVRQDAQLFLDNPQVI